MKNNETHAEVMPLDDCFSLHMKTATSDGTCTAVLSIDLTFPSRIAAYRFLAKALPVLNELNLERIEPHA